jgi:hypothetical protein
MMNRKDELEEENRYDLQDGGTVSSLPFYLWDRESI